MHKGDAKTITPVAYVGRDNYQFVLLLTCASLHCKNCLSDLTPLLPEKKIHTPVSVCGKTIHQYHHACPTLSKKNAQVDL